MAFFALKNLATVATEPCVPWEVNLLHKIPPKCLDDKAARVKWMMNPQTEYNAFNSFEGVNPNQRIRGTGENNNPPLYHHALIIDVDYPLSEAEVQGALSRMTLKPNWQERSLSKNWLFIWQFEKPICMASYDFAVLWLSMIDQIIPFRQLAGIDNGAVTAPERYYTNGCQWEHLHSNPVPADLLLGLLQTVSAKYNWSAPTLGVAVPLDVASVELAKKFPRFAEWEGDFVLDSQGPTFWVDGSSSSKSAIVRATGIQTFSDHATKAFYSWSELLGGEFVKQFKLAEMGRAVDGIYYDGRSFIRQNSKQEWLWEDKESLSLHLRVARGLSDKRAKGQNFSPIDEALLTIKDHALIASAGSFAGYQKGLMKFNGSTYLNIHHRDALTPAQEPAIWGPDGNFPFISGFLQEFLSSPDQLDFLLSWASRFYRSIQLRDPRAGQALFLFGPPNRGKTFFTNAILAGVAGGHAEAKAFLMGEDGFNSELFEFCLWTVDDGSVGSNQKLLNHFAETVKRCAANKTFRSNEKFRKAAQVQWEGRIAVSGNIDPESLRQIPNLDISMREKVMLFRVADHRADGFVFPEQDETRRILARELAYFARFLFDYQIPDHCRSEHTRYGVKEYHEPSLLCEANHSSVSASFGEILDEWQREFFTIREPHAKEWVGTALQLHKSILLDAGMSEAMKPYNVLTVSRMLSNLAVKNVFDIRIEGDEHRRLFRIKRDNRYPSPKTHIISANATKFSR